VKRTVKADLFPGPVLRVEADSVGAQEHLALAKRLLEITFHPLELVEPSPFAVANFISSRPQPISRKPLLAAALRFVGLSSAPAKDAGALNLELQGLEQRLLNIRTSSETLTRQHRNAFKPVLQEAAALAAKLKDVPAIRLSSLEQLREKHLALALEKHLEGFLLRRTKIPGIGGTRMAALLSAGITTAADVREENLGTVPWIGPSCVAKLLTWRSECEAGFKFNASAAVPETLRAQLNAFVSREIAELTRTGRRLEQTHHEAMAAYAKEFGKLHQEFESLWKQRAAVQSDLKILGGP
jgi:hypothetical protein